jgi:hypothetical protein
MKSKALSEDKIIRIIESCNDKILESVLDNKINEISKVSKATHEGQLVV